MHYMNNNLTEVETDWATIIHQYGHSIDHQMSQDVLFNALSISNMTTSVTSSQDSKAAFESYFKLQRCGVLYHTLKYQVIGQRQIY